MPMWALNAAPTFVAMIMKLKMKWTTFANERGLKNVASKIIVDDMSLYGCTDKQLLAYFRTFLDVMKHQHATIKLKKYKFISRQMLVFMYGRGSRRNKNCTVQK